MDQAQETALARKLRAMDEQAWALFCRDYSPVLLHFVQLAFACGPDRAEEVVQMTLVRCIRSIGTFDASKGRLLPWLKAIARNEAHTSLKHGVATESQGPRQVPLDEVAPWLLVEIDRSPLPEEVLARRDVQQLVRETLVQLNARHRDVLVAKYIDGKRVTQIATEMNASEKTVESLLTRARESFRAIMAQRFAGRPDDEMRELRSV
jgi:RNA polymerase sigma-70 factor, ECF subfamily